MNTLFSLSFLLLSIFSLESHGGRRQKQPRRIFIDKDITAYHFHTYFYDQTPASLHEAMTFRKALRHQINTGFLHECSLNQVLIGQDGPHPYSQFELCCNKTSFAEATAFHMQNHGNLSVLTHPLTLEDLDDHSIRATWMGKMIPLDFDCNGCLVETLPTPRICPVYPNYPDRPPKRGVHYTPVVGTEDYRYKGSITDTSGHHPHTQGEYIQANVFPLLLK